MQQSLLRKQKSREENFTIKVCFIMKYVSQLFALQIIRNTIKENKIRYF